MKVRQRRIRGLNQLRAYRAFYGADDEGEDYMSPQSILDREERGGAHDAEAAAAVEQVAAQQAAAMTAASSPASPGLSGFAMYALLAGGAYVAWKVLK